MASLFGAYMRQLRVNTLRTQMLTSATIMALGNIITQQGVYRRGWDKHDWKATARFSVYGCFLFTPLANRWHYLMNRIQYPSLLRTTVTRLSLDTAVFAPFVTAWFFLWMGVLEGRPLPEIRQRLQTNFQPVLTRAWLVFGPAQVLNLSFVPVYARPPFMNLVGLVWSTYLSSVSAELEKQSFGQQKLSRSERIEELQRESTAAAVME